MTQLEFDRYAVAYRDQHRSNVAATGEPPAYFSAYEMRDFRGLADRLGLPADGRYLDFGSGIGASVHHFLAEMPQARLVSSDVSAVSLAISREVHGNVGTHAVSLSSLRLRLVLERVASTLDDAMARALSR